MMQNTQRIFCSYYLVNCRECCLYSVVRTPVFQQSQILYVLKWNAVCYVRYPADLLSKIRYEYLLLLKSLGKVPGHWAETAMA